MRARLPRFEELASNLGKELQLWRSADHPLNDSDLTVYWHGLLEAIQGLVKGQGVLEKALARVDREERLRG
jgi:hypothetical protein